MCVLAPSVAYLGHIISKFGVQPLTENVSAVIRAPETKNITELKSFLGMYNFYAKFVPNAATILEPLYDLLKKNVKWNFERKCKNSFLKAKQMLTSTSILDHYDPDKELNLTVNASSVGIGAVISQKYKNGTGKPVAFASRVLSTAER